MQKDCKRGRRERKEKLILLVLYSSPIYCFEVFSINVCSRDFLLLVFCFCMCFCTEEKNRTPSPFLHNVQLLEKGMQLNSTLFVEHQRERENLKVLRILLAEQWFIFPFHAKYLNYISFCLTNNVLETFIARLKNFAGLSQFEMHI